ncbi:zinc finger protein 658B [Limanda limanda]|uniref:zinc finger protein 658B n=1 Tax=Limanda limanda TaxID=27771 RepID=UPI0029C9667D|nr:zinc finger protein 658B [Limanda limanda]
MAAADPSESPTRQKHPAEDVETCAERSLKQRDEPTRSGSTESRHDERGVAAGEDRGGVASHSGVSVSSGAGADNTTCNSPEDQRTAGKMAEVAGSKQRAFDWSEDEDGEEEEEEEEARSHKEEDDKSDPSNVTERADKVQQDAHVDGTVAADPKEVPEEENPQSSTDMVPEEQGSTEKVPEEQNSQTSTEKEVPVVQNSETSTEKEVPVVQNSERSPEKEVPEEQLGDADGTEDAVEDEEEADRGEDADLAAKPKKCRLVCKECGMRFNRRETFNLHRHFHAHADELTPLTCKECGLTFQHRSGLIKHKNEHKEKEEELVTPKKEVQTKEEVSVQCAECRRIFSTVDKLRDHSCINTVEYPYHCPLCRQDFQYRMSITKHMKIHSQESIFTCQECNKSFPNTTDLRYHQRCHTALKPYECPECGLVFKHYSVMEDHRRKHTDSARSHLCTICGKTFKYSSLLHQHQYLHTGQKPFRCPECGKTFAFAQNMKAHCRQHRLRETSSPMEQPCKPMPVPVQEEVKGLGKENSDQSEETKRTFRCPLCSEAYSSPANLRAHMLIHEAEYETLDRIPKPPKDINKHWEKGHACPHCPCVYRDESSLKIHLLSVHKLVAYLKKKSAPPRNQVYLQRSDNVKVKWRSDGIGIETHKCSECGKTFRHRSVLELHMRIHSKDKPYQCKECGKSFRFSSYLQQHVIIHTGQKPYKCPDCGKDFAFLQNMRTHQKLHQEKPFRCTNCRKGYSDETQLQQHMLSHNGDKPHKCHMCDKSFGLAYLLRDHMNTHTGERPHQCDECHKTFSWFSSLLVHQKIHTRKRQGFSQYNSLAMSARMRGRGSRGRRGGRFMLGWSRPLGGSGMLNSQPTKFPDSALSGPELHSRAEQQQSSMVSWNIDLPTRQMKDPWTFELQPQPVQWTVDGGEVMPVPSSQQQHAAPRQAQIEIPLQAGLQQRSPGWADSPLITHAGPASAPSLESSQVKESTASFVRSHLASVPKKSIPLAVSEVEQHRQPIPITWSMAPMSTVVASTSSLQNDFSIPSYIDGAALWSIRPSANSPSIPNQLASQRGPQA